MSFCNLSHGCPSEHRILKVGLTLFLSSSVPPIMERIPLLFGWMGCPFKRQRKLRSCSPYRRPEFGDTHRIRRARGIRKVLGQITFVWSVPSA